MNSLNEFFKSKIALPYFDSLWYTKIKDYSILDCVIFDAIGYAKKLYNNNPYHNFNHASSVAYYIFKYYKEYNLSIDELRAALIGAFFHDAMHSGTYTSKYADKHNILAAKYYCAKFLLKYGYSTDSPIVTIALRTIDCTMFYEGAFPNRTFFGYQQAIRDADLLNSIDYISQYEILDNLKLEMGNIDSNLKFMLANLRFLGSQTIFSQKAVTRRNQYIIRTYQEMEYVFGKKLLGKN